MTNRADELPFAQETLGRDKIPEIVRASGRTPVSQFVTGRQFIDRLLEKLVEEHAELLASENLEEIVDMLEVLFALARRFGHSEEAVLCHRRGKQRNAVDSIRRCSWRRL